MSDSITPGPTHVACLTPAGTGAIGTLGLRGALAWPVVRAIFRPRSAATGKLPLEAVPGRSWLGRLGEDPDGGKADEVVVVVKQTCPVPWLEIHCHGGRQVIRYLLEILTDRGLHSCSWQELEGHSGASPGRTAALAALAEARTARTAGILLDQYNGALDKALAAVRAALEGGNVEEARKQLQELVRHAALGRRLTAPWRVVVAGAPNVGKSSLVNALAGYQRSIVAATPGTTRDVVTTVLAVDGWPMELADTAGLRSEGTSLEQLGMDQAHRAVGQADLCLWVLDASTPPVWPSLPAPAIQYVVNKIDLPAAWDVTALAGAARVSAKTGAGLEDLCQALARWLVPEPPAPGAAVPFTPLLGNRLATAHSFCIENRPAEALSLLRSIWDPSER